MRTADIIPVAAPATDMAMALAGYGRCWPGEAAVVAQFQALLVDPADPFVRERLQGHFTGSAWLVDRGGTRVLLTHHRKLERWLQLGGHADGDRDLARVALREAAEESGLKDLRGEATPFDLDRHWIPARGEVPGHWHYDVRYVVHAGEDENYVVSDESHDLAWRDIADIADDTDADESLRRMARKWQARPSDLNQRGPQTRRCWC
jgi:8-oxo-dGTP pyrophosphatase MutT (NUDIX family)